MSTVLVITPIVIASWPAITAAITAAVASLGFSMIQERAALAATSTDMAREVIDVEDSEILAGAEGRDEQIVVEKDGIRATFSRDARGALRVCMEGHGLTKRQLRQLGEELVGRVTQQIVYHRIMTELGERKMTVVDEEVTENRAVRIRVRNW